MAGEWLKLSHEKKQNRVFIFLLFFFSVLSASFSEPNDSPSPITRSNGSGQNGGRVIRVSEVKCPVITFMKCTLTGGIMGLKLGLFFSHTSTSAPFWLPKARVSVPSETIQT